MSKGFVYCSECGTPLQVTRKALPKYNTILDMIEPHVCSEKPAELNLTPNQVSPFVAMQKKKGKFAEKLESIQPIPPFPLPNAEDDLTLRDKRGKDDVRSDIPLGILSHVRGFKEPED